MGRSEEGRERVRGERERRVRRRREGRGWRRVKGVVRRRMNLVELPITASAYGGVRESEGGEGR